MTAKKKTAGRRKAASASQANAAGSPVPEGEAGAAGPGRPLLDRAAILAADDLQREVVYVPEWGGIIYVRAMTAADRDRFEVECLTGNAVLDAIADGIGLRARLAIATVCDAEGVRLFTQDDGPALAEKSGRALDRIYPIASRLNGLTENDVAELAKN